MAVQDLSKFAYVTLVMKGDSYVPGALVLASSLRRTGSSVDSVCMVTPDVSDAAQRVLGMLYTKVVITDYTRAKVCKMKSKTSRRMEQLYFTMWPTILTKFNCLDLEGYTNVCLLDADVVVLRCMDAIFATGTLAGSFHNYYVHDESNPYPRDMKTGDIVPRDTIIKASTLENSFLVSGSPLILPVHRDILSQFKTYIEDIQEKHGFIGFPHMCAGVDETTITMFFTDVLKEEWRYIGLEYACVPWKDSQSEPYLYHYVHKKPWTMEEGTWPDLTPWFHEAHWICKEYPSAEKFFNLKSSVNTSEDKDDDKLGGLLVQLKLMSEDRRC